MDGGALGFGPLASAAVGPSPGRALDHASVHCPGTVSIAFVFTNPRHHLEMMAPVARLLTAQGIRTRLVSLAELRGFDTPEDRGLVRVIPVNPRKQLARLRPRARAASPGAAPAGPPRETSLTRRLAQEAVWTLLRPRLRSCLGDARVVVVPNDAVYPYIELLAMLDARRVRTALLQEGIRFPLPLPAARHRYGGGGTDLVCAWGAGSRDYFLAEGTPAAAVRVTGSPRADVVDLERWRPEGSALRERLGLRAAPIVFCSNPVELQGYGTEASKLGLFAAWLEASAPLLEARGLEVLVKPHPQENAQAFARVAATTAAAARVRVIPDEPTFAALAIARAAVVLTSTVGLEALMLGIPLAQLVLPGHAPAFEYVSAGVAVALTPGELAGQMQQLLDAPPRAGAAAFVERHLFDRGHASENVAAALAELLAQPRV